MYASRLRRLGALPAALATLALTAAACHAAAPESPADRAFGERVHAYLLAHPEVLEEAFQQLQVREDAVKAEGARAAIAARKTLLEADPRDAVLGNPKGRVTVVEFFDYRCPFCKASEPGVQKLLADNPDVRLVLKQFPILDVEDNSHISEDASRAAIAARAQGKFGPVHRELLAQKRLDEAGIASVLKANGVDAAAAGPVESAAATTTTLADTRALARALGIDGTPAFIVGDQMISGAQMDALEAAVKSARQAPASSPTARRPAA